LLGGELVVSGDPKLVVTVKRLFPTPRRAGGIGAAGRRARRPATTRDDGQIHDGNTFVVSDDRVDFEALRRMRPASSHYDTRFLSTWVLTVDGRRGRRS
jgi:hypothetical protein